MCSRQIIVNAKFQSCVLTGWSVTGVLDISSSLISSQCVFLHLHFFFFNLSVNL